jgi:hypothetical protein
MRPLVAHPHHLISSTFFQKVVKNQNALAIVIFGALELITERTTVLKYLKPLNYR